MAIGALLGEQHSFMHDLKSFLGCYSGCASTIVGRTELESRNFLGTKPLAIQKFGYAAQEFIFIRVMTESFTPYYKLWRVVFLSANNGQKEDERL